MDKSETQDNKLYDFFHKLDRAFFIENENKQFAHNDEALPIGYEQTISQPSLVLEMTELLDVNKQCKVLEIGTGSGYQTVFLAELAREVYTVERIKELSWKAVERFMKLGYANVQFRIGDGSEGWEEFAPYDRIMVTAGAGEVPQALLEQLKPGGKMVIPVGVKGKQQLLLIRKDEGGKVTTKIMGMVKFVELKGEYGWNQ